MYCHPITLFLRYALIVKIKVHQNVIEKETFLSILSEATDKVGGR
jgi:hypothetical protein